MRSEDQPIRISAAALAASGSDTEWSADVSGAVTTTTLVRVEMASGITGYGATAAYSMGAPDLSALSALAPLAQSALNSGNPAPASAMAYARRMPQLPTLGAVSALDIALWDVLGRTAGLPLYAVLGGTAADLRAYASLPFLGEIPRYLDTIEELAADGFTAIKLHTWCEPAKDLALMDAVADTFGDRLTFMLDIEQHYSRSQAVAVARVLDTLGWEWFEAPMPDEDIEGYVALRDSCSTAVLCSGNLLVDPRTVLLGAQRRAWDALRFDVTLAGGITASQTLAEIGVATNLGMELQSWGHTLIQAANLHLGIATGRMRYVELAVPLAQYEIGVGNPLAVGADGLVAAPQDAGLGVDIDWNAIVAASVESFTRSVR